MPGISTLAKFILERGERRKGFLTQDQPGPCQHTGQQFQQKNNHKQEIRGGLQRYGEQEKPSHKMVYFSASKHSLGYLCLISRMALWAEDNQLAVLASATLPERNQAAEAGVLASERPSDLSNGARTKPPVHNKLLERRKGKKQQR